VTDQALALAEEFRARGDLQSAAALLDATAREERASAIEPLRRVLDALAVAEHGIVFRYVPAGTFTMGSVDGDPDEAPLHEVVLPGFWMSDVPLSWSVCARLLGWPEPPARPNEEAIAAVRAALSGRATAGPPPRLGRPSMTSSTSRSASNTARTTPSAPAIGTLTIRRKCGRGTVSRGKSSARPSGPRAVHIATTRSRWSPSSGHLRISLPGRSRRTRPSIDFRQRPSGSERPGVVSHQLRTLGAPPNRMPRRQTSSASRNFPFSSHGPFLRTTTASSPWRAAFGSGAPTTTTRPTTRAARARRRGADYLMRSSDANTCCAAGRGQTARRRFERAFAAPRCVERRPTSVLGSCACLATPRASGRARDTGQTVISLGFERGSVAWQRQQTGTCRRIQASPRLLE
jgi:hypothetical protein